MIAHVEQSVNARVGNTLADSSLETTTSSGTPRRSQLVATPTLFVCVSGSLRDSVVTCEFGVSSNNFTAGFCHIVGSQCPRKPEIDERYLVFLSQSFPVWSRALTTTDERFVLVIFIIPNEIVRRESSSHCVTLEMFKEPRKQG